jgi:ribosomal protein S24E
MPHIATSMEMLAKSERHYILKKDERTIEENQNKSHLEFMKSVTDIIKPIINNKS